MLLLCGKSCAGKDTIQKELVKMGMQSVVSYTTRPPREHETDGVEYHFITKDDFMKKERKGFFAETCHYDVALSDRWYYGSAVEDLLDDKVMIANPCGLEQLRRIKLLNPISFYITASEATILERLRKRGDDAAEARRRIAADNEDFSDIVNNVDFSFSNDLGLPPQILAQIILNTYETVMREKQC